MILLNTVYWVILVFWWVKLREPNSNTPKIPYDSEHFISPNYW